MDNKLGDIKIADDMNYENYEKTSIESFGKEMLYRMGWKDNQPIREGGPVKPIEFKMRNSGLGLGADPLLEKMKDDKLNKKNKGFYYGTKVRITGGKHKGLKGRLVEKNVEDLQTFLNDNKYVNVELKINKQVVKLESE